MPRFAGIKDDRICVVSSNCYDHRDYAFVQVPIELDHIASQSLITNYRFRNGEFKSKTIRKPVKDIKLALVGNFRMHCGISTYNEKLWGEITKHIDNFKLFIEKNDILTGDIHQVGDRIISDEQISVCWKRGEPLQELVKELKAYDPDIILIGHEFGLWGNAAQWLGLMSQLSDYRVITTMHSVFYHRDKTICEAAMPEIVVHLEGARTVLKGVKKIPGKVYVIPHGCEPCVDKERLWNYYKSDRTFVQLGFGFRYKGFETSIKATAILKQKYPDVFFTALFSESPHNMQGHQVYYDELIQLVEQLDLQENVAIIRGFQSDETLDSYLRTNKVAIFPYQSNKEHECFGSSGAAPLAMTKAIPVISSSIHHFEGLPTIKADAPENVARELDNLFSNEIAVKEQLLKQDQYLLDNSWEKTALRYIDLFTGD